ncbi:MAG: cytochrome bc complex cytochrome b subunit [Desulfuromonadales bacterium]|nr:cytochrome bc complex cytochrome b subunit [Desulfuromonadales bacterium]
MKKFLIDWLDERLAVRALLHNQLTGYLLPRTLTVWHTLGAVLLALFGLQLLTGILLLVYYIPSPETAFSSVERIMNDVPFGWLIRTLHAVGSNIIVVALLLHMVSVAFMGSYKKPRELTWLSGFILFNLGLVLCLTGYLLPWSQLSFWATTVATDAAGAVPIVGAKLVEFLRGGPMVSGVTLGRFFALHVIVLPLALFGLIGFHLYSMRRTGIATPPFGADYQQPDAADIPLHEEHQGGIPFFPNFVVKDGAMIMFFLALLVMVSFFIPQLFFPPSTLEPADPFTTPEKIKPEWYFLWAYQTLKIFPSKLIGLGVQGAFMTFLALLPFIDIGAERRPARRPVFLTVYFLILLIFLALSIWGHFS